MMAEGKDYSNTNLFPAVYASYYPMLRKIAIEHGYSLAIHGSMTRDFDLVAVAWVEKPKSHYDMLKAMGEKLGCYWIGFAEEYIRSTEVKKPHGRLGYVMVLAQNCPAYIDISVVPAKEKFIDEEKLWLNIY